MTYSDILVSLSNSYKQHGIYDTSMSQKHNNTANPGDMTIFNNRKVIGTFHYKRCLK